MLPIVAIAALALVSIAALALDAGHAMLNKSRLQNTVDAAALSAAKTIDQSGATDAATAAALAVFRANAHAEGNKELGRFYDGGGDIDVQFSATLYPFAPGSQPPRYVRVRVSDFSLETWIIGALGITDKKVAASAVAGPSPPLSADDEVCKLAPLLVCGDPAAPPETHFGYDIGDVQRLKSGASQGEWDVGPGNFQLVRMSALGGGDALRYGLAGSYSACFEPNVDIETEPGNSVGPAAQGLNTRFGNYTGPMSGTESLYPPDVVVTQNTVEIELDAQGEVITQPNDLDLNYDIYATKVANGEYDYPPAPGGSGRFQRRVMALPIGDCSGTTQGQGEVPLLGYGCFFLLQELAQQGNISSVYGQFVEECTVTGNPGPQPGGDPGVSDAGPHIIQLYEDPTSNDS